MTSRDPSSAAAPGAAAGASRPLNAHKLDVAAFIDAEAELTGSSPLTAMPRLQESLAPEAQPAQLQVHWQITGWLEPQRVGEPHRWMRIEAQAELPWTCQRCLTPVTLPVSVDRDIRWVSGENKAAELDSEMEDDVLALERQSDILALIEDELIMEAPLVPRHDTCPVPVILSTDDLDDAPEVPEVEEKPNPFAVLASLKKGSKPD